MTQSPTSIDSPIFFTSAIHRWQGGLRRKLPRKQIFLRNDRISVAQSVDGVEYRQVVLQVANATYIFQYRIDGDRLVMLRVFHGREVREE
jgi:hypothetical protein